MNSALADLNSGRTFVNNIQAKIIDTVKWATNNGARSMDPNWEHGAVKRFAAAHINNHLSGKQFGNRAAAKIAVAKSKTFAELTAAIEKYVDTAK